MTNRTLLIAACLISTSVASIYSGREMSRAKQAQAREDRIYKEIMTRYQGPNGEPILQIIPLGEQDGFDAWELVRKSKEGPPLRFRVKRSRGEVANWLKPEPVVEYAANDSTNR